MHLHDMTAYLLYIWDGMNESFLCLCGGDTVRANATCAEAYSQPSAQANIVQSTL